MGWTEVKPGPLPKPGLIGGLRLMVRLPVIVIAFVVLVVLFLLVRLVEKATGGKRVSGALARLWGRVGHGLSGLRLEIVGREMAHGGAIVANHSSWLDIFVLHSAAHIHFVSKAEVASWPVIGWMARVTGTVFIERRPSAAKHQQAQLAERIAAGDKLCFFPEGTSTDGLRVLPFKSTLFGVFQSDSLRDLVWVQPVTVSYFPPKGRDTRFYGWWGDMYFGPHALMILGLSVGGRVRVTFHAPLKVADFEGRKPLAKAAEIAVREGQREAIGPRYIGAL
ncbi:MAG: 1-acyl-sn-glycerol-3-phosphate acyltransferase [Rhodobacteraceae bacterium]|nr:1-acyl-sn-glycerol-3-phosphate acyltransferase [Paracoccaceae bacterium]